MLKYQLRTGNYLPKLKKWFECQCEAIDFIKRFLQEHAQNLNKDEIGVSVSLVRWDPEKMPLGAAMFPSEK